MDLFRFRVYNVQGNAAELLQLGVVQRLIANRLHCLVHQLVPGALQPVANTARSALELAALLGVHRLPGGIRVLLVLEGSIEGLVDGAQVVRTYGRSENGGPVGGKLISYYTLRLNKPI